MIEIEKVDHLGIRVMDVDHALAFYALLGFGDSYKVPDDDVTIIKNKHGVEINLITNGSNNNEGNNILMDVHEKYPGYTHVALRVTSVVETMKFLQAHNIPITGGPVDFGDGNLSVFVRDPDRNVIELRGRGNEKLTKDQYRPQ
jgi:lactoylglutathione lyase